MNQLPLNAPANQINRAGGLLRLVTLATAAAIFLTASPIWAAPQKGKGEGKGEGKVKERQDDAKERAKERNEDAKERTKERNEDAKERTKERKEDGREKINDNVRNKAAVDARVKGRGYVRPEIATRVNGYWGRVAVARRPFTATWYKSHPQAWRYSYAIGRPWAPATWGSVARFVGIGAGPVVFAYDNRPAPLTPGQWAVLAKTESAEGLAEADVMPLGVYSLLPPDATDSSTMLQLNISKNGAIVGSYYDMLSDTGHAVQGSLDRESQRAMWTVGTNREVAFETGLENLTTDGAPLIVHLKDGTIQKWTLVRVADEGGPQGGE